MSIIKKQHEEKQRMKFRRAILGGGKGNVN
jgi:hypothetical protein